MTLEASHLERTALSSPGLPLTELAPGDAGWLEAADLVDADRQLLQALGFVPSSRFRVCQTGDPWIVQVMGTRIGLAESVARRLRVVRDGAEARDRGADPDDRHPVA